MKTTAPLWTSRARRVVVNPRQAFLTLLFWVCALGIGLAAVAGGSVFALALGASQTSTSDQALAFYWIGVVPMIMWTALIKYLHTRSFFAEERLANRQVVHALYFAMPPLVITALQPIMAHAVLTSNNIAATAVPLGAAFISFAGWFILGELNDLASASAISPSYIAARAR